MGAEAPKWVKLTWLGAFAPHFAPQNCCARFLRQPARRLPAANVPTVAIAPLNIAFTAERISFCAFVVHSSPGNCSRISVEHEEGTIRRLSKYGGRIYDHEGILGFSVGVAESAPR